MVNSLEFYKGKRVFITGHTGFKGTWLSSYLNVIGAKCSGFSLEPDTRPSHFKILNFSGESTIGDISNIDLLRKSLNSFKPDIVFHLAAQPLVRESYRRPLETYQTNVIGTLNVLEAIKQCNSVTAVVFITTDKVYENKEWVYPYRETDLLGGYDMYSSSKACAELLVKSYERSFFNLQEYGISHSVLMATARAGNVIGGGDWSIDRLIPDLIRATVNKKITQIRSPNAVRPWQHVLDCIYGYLLLGEKLLKGQMEFSGAWNFSPYSFESKTVREVAELSKSLWSDIEIEFGEPVNDDMHEANLLKLDNTKSLVYLGWKPKWNTEKAIEQTIRWYRDYYLTGKVLTHKQIKDFSS